MPSVFTISGAAAPKRRRRKARKRKRSSNPNAGLGLRGAPAHCKYVPSGRGGCEILLCKNKKSRTGWAFKKGSRRCR